MECAYNHVILCMPEHFNMPIKRRQWCEP